LLKGTTRGCCAVGDEKKRFLPSVEQPTRRGSWAMAVVQVLGDTPVFRERVTLEVSQLFRVRGHIADKVVEEGVV
jgi:hypothetical protein